MCQADRGEHRELKAMGLLLMEDVMWGSWWVGEKTSGVVLDS